MSKFRALVGRKFVKLGVLAVGVIAVAVTSTGISLAALQSVQIEVCGGGTAGTVKLSGKNQDNQDATSNEFNFPASGCQLLANFHWATAHGQVTATINFEAGKFFEVKCGIGGIADGSTVSCTMPAGAPTEPGTFEAKTVPTKDNPDVSGTGTAFVLDEAKRVARAGLENLCKEAGYTGGLDSVTEEESKTPDNKILVTASGKCKNSEGPVVEDSRG